MSSPTDLGRAAPPGPALRSRGVLLLFLAYAALSFGLLVASDAAQSDFGGFEDEPAHLVSSLLVHDYLRAGLPGHPIAFAKEYYLHYPKVTIGHWPPVLPALLGLWMLAAGTTPFAILSLFALLAAGAALLVYLGARRDAGDAPAAGFGALFLLAPTVQHFGHMVLTELVLALACGLAVLSFGRFLEQGRARHALLFAVLAAAGVMTKGSALSLALVPLPAIALAGRWPLLRRPALWGAAALVAALCAPWYWATIGISVTSWQGSSTPTLWHTSQAAPYYAWHLLAIAGAGAGLLALVGLAGALLGPLRATRWAAFAVWVPSHVLCHVLIPTGPQARHLVVVLPVWLMASALGTRLLVNRFPRLAVGRVHAVPALVVLAFLPLVGVPRKDCRGYGDAASAVLASPELGRGPLLVVSDSTGEGAFVAAVALLEERPSTIVLRGSKVLARTDWMGYEYRPFFQDQESLAEFLAEVGVTAVVIDGSVPAERRLPHELALEQLVRERTWAWAPAGVFDVERRGQRHEDALRVWRQVDLPPEPRRVLAFEDVVGRDLHGFAQ